MYFFEAILNQNKPASTLIVFSGQLEGDDFDYGFNIETGFKNFAIGPEKVIFIYPEYLSNQIGQYLVSGSRLESNLTRYGENVPVEIYSFNVHGNLSLIKVINNSSSSVGDLKNIQLAIVREGLTNLVKNRRNNIILKSPPGTTFLKPSGEEFEEFDHPPKIRTMNSMRFPSNLVQRRSHHEEEALHRRTDHQGHSGA